MNIEEKRLIKNVVIINDHGYICGGASKIALQTAVGLAERGINVYFFCAVSPISDELIRDNITVVCLDQQDSLNCTSKLRGMRQGLHNKKAERELKTLLAGLDSAETIVHIHSWTKALSSIIFKVAEKAGFDTFITVHDYFLVCPNGGLFNYKKNTVCELKPMSIGCRFCNCDSRNYAYKLYRLLRQSKQNKAIRKNKRLYFIFISEFSEFQFIKRFGEIPSDKRFFLSNPTEFVAERKRVECENNDTYLFIGSLAETKGIRLFCKAVTEARVKAVVIGDGILKKELEADYPGIEFTGWKSKAEMLPYMEKTRCLVFPSVWYETFGLVPKEALAYGIPVICSDKNAAKDYIEDGVNGCLYDGGSVDALVSAIMKMSDINIKEMSEKIFEKFEDTERSIETYVSDLLEMYDKVKKDTDGIVAI